MCLSRVPGCPSLPQRAPARLAQRLIIDRSRGCCANKVLPLPRRMKPRHFGLSLPRESRDSSCSPGASHAVVSVERHPTQQHNEATKGIAMVPPTQYDVSNHSPTARNRTRHPFTPASRAVRTGSAVTKSAASDQPSTFGEDFMLEHSFSGRTVTMIKMASDPSNVHKDLQHSPQAFGFPC
jgi:hypothetical protein